jgi:hypothetical protein
MADESKKEGKFEGMSQKQYEANQQKWFDQQKKKALADGQESSAVDLDNIPEAKAINPAPEGEQTKETKKAATTKKGGKK